MSTITQTRPYYASRGGSARSIQNTRDAIRGMQPFKSSGALSGHRGNYGSTGWLSPEERDEFHRVANHILYTVVSYGTPIGWAYRALANGDLPAPGQAAETIKWHRVKESFSPSTGRHQSMLLAALNGRRAVIQNGIYQSDPIEFEELD